MKKRLIAALILVNILSYTSIAFAEDITNLIQQQKNFRLLQFLQAGLMSGDM